MGLPFNEKVDINKDAMKKYIIREILSKDEEEETNVNFTTFILKLIDISFKHNLYMPPAILSFFRTKSMVGF
jgi:hypothetical protein